MGMRLRDAGSPRSGQPAPATLKYRRLVTDRPQASDARRHIHSPISLVSPYGLIGSHGAVSSTSSVLGMPYVAADDEKIMRRTPASSIASSRFTMPPTFWRM